MSILLRLEFCFNWITIFGILLVDLCFYTFSQQYFRTEYSINFSPRQVLLIGLQQLVTEPVLSPSTADLWD